MRNAVNTQKAMMKEIDIDQLDSLQDDMEDLMDDQEEVQEILGRDYSLNDFDEAQLEAELDELDDEILNKKLEGNNVPNYVPYQHKISVKNNHPANVMHI